MGLLVAFVFLSVFTFAFVFDTNILVQNSRLTTFFFFQYFQDVVPLTSCLEYFDEKSAIIFIFLCT